MGDEDLELLTFAEKNTNEREWELLTYYEGNCLIGCTTRKLLKTRNMLTALAWADYHREGAEHVGNLLKRREGSGVIMLPTNPPKFQEGTQ